MRSKRQNKVLKFWLWYMNFLLRILSRSIIMRAERQSDTKIAYFENTADRTSSLLNLHYNLYIAAIFFLDKISFSIVSCHSRYLASLRSSSRRYTSIPGPVWYAESHRQHVVSQSSPVINLKSTCTSIASCHYRGTIVRVCWTVTLEQPCEWHCGYSMTAGVSPFAVNFRHIYLETPTDISF